MNAPTQNKTVAITGNTYPVKEQLKALGARWNGDLKAWMISGEKAEEAQKIVAGAASQPRNPNATRPAFVHHRCKECGCAPGRYNRIYRNGQCKDCFVSEKEERDMGY